MSNYAAFIALLGLALPAQEPLEQPVGRIAVGSFVDRFSDATGTWKGSILSGEWYRDAHGPWSASISTSQRPEGTGTSFMVSKEHGFQGNSWVWGGISVGSGADFIPRFRADFDSNLDIHGNWGLGAGAFWSRFSGEESVGMLQAGPSWKRGEWSASARLQEIWYGSGGGSDTGLLGDLRWGSDNLSRWHSFRVAWGKGILDSVQPGGSLSSTGVAVGTGAGRGKGKGSGTEGTYGFLTSGNAPIEFLASTTAHLPLSRRIALKTEVGWGKREGQFNLWTGSVQLFYTF
jgi:YaiO family outer membrane protein